MEHYRKKRVRFYEAEALPNEIKVNNSGRAPDIVSKAARKLKVASYLYVFCINMGLVRRLALKVW